MRSVLTTFQSRFGHGDHAFVAATNPSPSGDLTLPTGRTRDLPRAVAEVNHGRWIATCPLVYGGRRCSGAELVDIEVGLFFCCACRNAAVGHDYLRTLIPDHTQRAEIERVLIDRSVDEVRNWKPQETVVDLRLENAAHRS